METAQMIDMLPAQDQTPAFELIKKLAPAWDPDHTKLTAKERAELEEAENDPETVAFDAIITSAIKQFDNLSTAQSLPK